MCETEDNTMWKIKQIFDGDYGCEELAPGAKPKVSVTLVNDAGEEKYISVEDGLLQNDFTEALNRGIVKSAVHPEYTCFLPGDYFRNEMSNLIRGQEMKLEYDPRSV